MHYKAITVFTLCMLVSEHSLADTVHKPSYKITFSDNTEITGGPNDLGPTGSLEFIYNNPDKEYQTSMKYELFVNDDPQEHTTSRTNPDDLRIDVFSLSYIQGGKFKYGAGFEIVGDLGGDSIQNAIHRATNNPRIAAKYSGPNKFTPTVNLEYKTKINDHINFYSTGKVPLIIDNGIIKFDAMVQYRSDNFYDWDLYTGIGLGVDCTRYPDLPAFNGYPLRDFQLCTPETTLSLAHKNFTFIWEIPLMNNDVQNSYFRLSYQF